MGDPGDLTDEELGAIERRHHQRVAIGIPACDYCLTGWPCDASHLVRALREARVCPNCGCTMECGGCGPRAVKTAVRLGEVEERAEAAERAMEQGKREYALRVNLCEDLKREVGVLREALKTAMGAVHQMLSEHANAYAGADISLSSVGTACADKAIREGEAALTSTAALAPSRPAGDPGKGEGHE